MYIARLLLRSDGSIASLGGLNTKMRSLSSSSYNLMLASNFSFLEDQDVPDAPSSVSDRILELLGKHPTGMLGSDIPRFYQSEYGERLQTPEDPETQERPKLKDFLLGLPGVSSFTRNTQPVFRLAQTTDAEAEAEAEVELPAPSHDNAIIGARLLEILSAERANGILGAQLPSKYLTIYGEPLQVNEPFLPHLTQIFTCLNCAPAGDRRGSDEAQGFFALRSDGWCFQIPEAFTHVHQSRT